MPISRSVPSVVFEDLAQAKTLAGGGILGANGKALYTGEKDKKAGKTPTPGFEAQRKERANARLVGIREKRAKEAAAKDAAAAKKAGKAGGGDEE